MADRVKVSATVAEAIQAVRTSGITNMLDRRNVVALMMEFGYEDEADWVRQNPKLYAEGLDAGFESAGGE